MKIRPFLRSLPGDITLGFCYLVVSSSVLLTWSGPLPVRGLLGFPLIFLIPGYALVSIFFPKSGHNVDIDVLQFDAADRDQGRIDLSERITLSFGFSIVVLPLLCIVLSNSPLGLTLQSLVLLLVTISGGGLTLSAVRRYRVSPQERFQLPVNRLYDGVSRKFFGRHSTLTVLLHVCLVVAILIAIGTLGIGVLFSGPDASYTSMTILSKAENGSYVAGGYSVGENESSPQFVAIENKEGERIDYTVVVQLQEVDVSENSVTVTEEREISRRQMSVSANQTEFSKYDISTGLESDDVRITYYLYKGDSPANPSTGSAYRHAYIWTNGNSGDG